MGLVFKALFGLGEDGSCFGRIWRGVWILFLSLCFYSNFSMELGIGEKQVSIKDKSIRRE